MLNDFLKTCEEFLSLLAFISDDVNANNDKNNKK